MSGGDRVTISVELGGGAQGHLVIDTTVDDSSSGGLRVTDDLTVEEVTALAREMTLKFSFIGRPSGGAKSGLRVPPHTIPEEKRRLLREFGRRLGPIIRKGVYSPGTDINCGTEDLRAVYAGAGLGLGNPTDTAVFTAIGAAAAVEACRVAAGRPMRRLRLAVEGFGAVAASLALRLPAEHYAFTALSTARGAVVNERGFDPRDLVEQKKRVGDALVERLDGDRCEREDLFGADVDIFIPSARTWSISPSRARTIRARFVAPVANAPYHGDAVAILESRSIACLPGFVVNCGGVFASSLFDSGVPLADVERLAAREFQAVVRALLAARERSGRSAVQLAEEIALERLARRAAEPRQRGYVRVARTLLRRNIPRRLYGTQYLSRFTRNLVDLERLVAARGSAAARAELRTGS